MFTSLVQPIYGDERWQYLHQHREKHTSTLTQWHTASDLHLPGLTNDHSFIYVSGSWLLLLTVARVSILHLIQAVIEGLPNGLSEDCKEKNHRSWRYFKTPKIFKVIKIAKATIKKTQQHFLIFIFNWREKHSTRHRFGVLFALLCNTDSCMTTNINRLENHHPNCQPHCSTLTQMHLDDTGPAWQGNVMDGMDGSSKALGYETHT